METIADTAGLARSGAVPVVGVGTIGLVVRDLGAVAAFYREVIGLRDIPGADGDITLGVGDRVLLTLAHRPDALPDDAREAGLYHTAFLMPSRADLADWLTHASAMRVAIDGASDHAVSEAIYLTDPEGNGVEVYADRPRTDWRWDDGQVRMTTARLDAADLLGQRSDAPWRGLPDAARIGHVHLRVGDVREATRFWTETLGLELVVARPGAAFLSVGRYHHHVDANSWHSAGAGARDPRRAGLDFVSLDAKASRSAIRDPWGTEIRFQERRPASVP